MKVLSQEGVVYIVDADVAFRDIVRFVGPRINLGEFDAVPHAGHYAGCRCRIEFDYRTCISLTAEMSIYEKLTINFGVSRADQYFVKSGHCLCFIRCLSTDLRRQ